MRVAIVYKYVPQYRAAFFELLRERAAAQDIWVDLYAGDPEPRDARRGDSMRLPWGHHVSNRHIHIGPLTGLYQPVLRPTRGYDFVVVEQAARLLYNYLAMLRSRTGGPRVIAWGHGRDLAASPDSNIESFKRRTLHWPDYWFAYSDETQQYLESAGIERGRISVVHNSKLVEWGESEHSRLGPAMLFVGSLEAHKGLEYLLQASDAVRERVKDVQFTVVGSGRLESLVDCYSASRPWVRRVPATHGAALGTLFRSSDIVLNPFGAGLTIVDAIQCGVPSALVHGGAHGPEYEYIQTGKNALVCPTGTTAQEFAAAVAEVLTDEPRRVMLAQGCRDSAPMCSLDRMVADFIEGLRNASRT